MKLSLLLDRCTRASAVIAVILSTIIATGCAGSQPIQPTQGTEESSGWTDANQSEAARVWIIAMPGSTISGNGLDLWIDAASGNERGGKGADQVGSTATSTQTPTGTLELPLVP